MREIAWRDDPRHPERFPADFEERCRMLPERDQVLSVTYFPTIILAWTIERMSILWEEEGGHEVLVQGSGSLLVAVLAYLAMSSRLVSHLTFNFPELTLSLLGLILLLGKYTGYRLSELYRFRNLGDES